MEWNVVSYWVGETGDAKVWNYPTKEQAIDAMQKLWEKSFNYALEDENFDKESSYHEEYFAVVAWNDELYRYFEVVKSEKNEEV